MNRIKIKEYVYEYSSTCYTKFYMQHNANVCSISPKDILEFLDYAQECYGDEIGTIKTKSSVDLDNLEKLVTDEDKMRIIREKICEDREFLKEFENGW